MRLSKREMVLLIILGVVLIVVLGVNFLIVPMQQSLLDLRSLISQKQDELVSARADTETSSALLQSIDEEYARTKELQKPYENSLRQEEIDLWLNNMLAYYNLEVANMDLSDIGTATADFSGTDAAAQEGQESLPIQDAADIVNGAAPPAQAQPSAQPSAQASAQESGDPYAQAATATATASAAPSEQASLYQLNAIVNCTGSFDDIIAFANGLYESGRALRITSLSTQEAGEDGRMPAVVTIEFYGIPAVGSGAQAGTGETQE